MRKRAWLEHPQLRRRSSHWYEIVLYYGILNRFAALPGAVQVPVVVNDQTLIAVLSDFDFVALAVFQNGVI